MFISDIMVLMTLLSNENNIVRYSYQPECEGDAGVLRYDGNSKSSIIEKKATRDVESAFYRGQVLRFIQKHINDLPVKELLMWY